MKEEIKSREPIYEILQTMEDKESIKIVKTQNKFITKFSQKKNVIIIIFEIKVIHYIQ
ncbi:hypothetical protein KM1_198650 [Entamoeba histolytica HM-3:IMSS]|uniref:Uncharacterized protein n=1 Tax=Entamoeba histolytica HM-3:IMSS TaxID=885315 RepID=M7VZ83_ENTHI|nr:hypothetical protein KM1_198650 [Entamoeba histolytica HM-3:IMSS]